MALQNQTLNTSYGSGLTERMHLFVQVETESGAIGTAEGSPLPHFNGEYAENMERVVSNRLAPALVGQDAGNTELLQQRLNAALAGNPSSKAALMNAVLDAQTKDLGVPAAQLLGGVLRRRFPIAGAAGIGEVEDVLERTRRLYEAGFRTIKLKVGTAVDRDVERVAAVRTEFGTALEIRADANGGYGRADARRFLERTRQYDLQYLEQPLPAADLSGLAGLRQVSATAIAVDESLYGLGDAIEVVRSEAADVFVIKLIKLGGLFNARKVVSVAEGAGVSCVVVSPYETDLGSAANVHLAASSDAFSFAIELGVGVTAVKMQGMDKLDSDHGSVSLPSGSGFGISAPDWLFRT